MEAQDPAPAYREVLTETLRRAARARAHRAAAGRRDDARRPLARAADLRRRRPRPLHAARERLEPRDPLQLRRRPARHHARAHAGPVRPDGDRRAGRLLQARSLRTGTASSSAPRATAAAGSTPPSRGSTTSRPPRSAACHASGSTGSTRARTRSSPPSGSPTSGACLRRSRKPQPPPELVVGRPPVAARHQAGVEARGRAPEERVDVEPLDPRVALREREHVLRRAQLAARRRAEAAEAVDPAGLGEPDLLALERLDDLARPGVAEAVGVGVVVDPAEPPRRLQGLLEALDVAQRRAEARLLRVARCRPGRGCRRPPPGSRGTRGARCRRSARPPRVLGGRLREVVDLVPRDVGASPTGSACGTAGSGSGRSARSAACTGGCGARTSSRGSARRRRVRARR